MNPKIVLSMVLFVISGCSHKALTPAPLKEVSLGGLSYLTYQGQNSEGCAQFLTGTDRGPNGVEFQVGPKLGRVFLSPTFNPHLVRFFLCGEQIKTGEAISLKNQKGELLTGLPPRDQGKDGWGYDSNKKALAPDLKGIDPEGVAVDSQGHFWVSEEYLPSLSEFDSSGKLLRRLAPKNSMSKALADKAGIQMTLPEVLNRRFLNLGFEAMTLIQGKIYFMTQSPLDMGNKNNRLVRLYVLDPASGKVEKEFLYPLQDPLNKIGDMAVSPSGKIALVEQNGLPTEKGFRKVYEIQFSEATALDPDTKPRKAYELMSEEEFAKVSIKFVKKIEILDLIQAGFNFQKIEGFTFIDDNRIALVNDNDFGAAPQFSGSTTHLGIFTLGK